MPPTSCALTVLRANGYRNDKTAFATVNILIQRLCMADSERAFEITSKFSVAVLNGWKEIRMKPLLMVDALMKTY